MKKLLLVLIAVFGVLPLFAKGYADYLAEARKYEAQKKWCFALGSYYDALGTDESPENKKEANARYWMLRGAISNGNPGLNGTSDLFALHDEWKNLLCDAEKYGSSICVGEMELSLKQDDLDYDTRTVSYKALVSWKGYSQRYEATIGIVEKGYQIARNSKWKDLPREWPMYSASYQNNKVYNVKGALVYEEMSLTGDDGPRFYNAFSVTTRKGAHFTRNERLYDFELNIVDKNGKELVKPRRCLCNDENGTVFKGVTSDIMKLIQNGEAFLNPVACYLEYGQYNLYDDKGGRTFIKNLPEIQISLSKCVVARWNGTEYSVNDEIGTRFYNTVNQEKLKQQELERKQREAERLENERIEQELREKPKRDFETKIENLFNYMAAITVDGKTIQVYKTEVTEELFYGVMDGDYTRSPDRPVSLPMGQGDVLLKVFEFCNKLSEIKGLKPVYKLNGTFKIDSSANGFRIPTFNEWKFAGKGGEKYKYAGSDKLDDVAWYARNSGGHFCYYIAV